jgi:drug/metabolite transporter (DMT)-like permease
MIDNSALEIEKSQENLADLASSPISRNVWNYLGFFLLTAFWGGSYTAIKFTVLQFPPIFSAMLRLVIAEIFLVLLIVFKKKSIRVSINLCPKIWLTGLFAMGFPFALLFWGEQFVVPGLAGILCATAPLWALIFGLIFLRHNISVSPSKFIGLLLGLFGVVIIFWPMLHANGRPHELTGSIMIVFMAVCYAIAALLNQQMLNGQQVPFYANIFHQILASVAFLFLVSVFFEKWPSFHTLMHSSQMWIASLYLGICSSAIAWLLYYYLIREWDAIRASSATYVAPAMAILWDLVFFNTKPFFSEILGVLIMLVGIIMIQFCKKMKT